MFRHRSAFGCSLAVALVALAWGDLHASAAAPGSVEDPVDAGQVMIVDAGTLSSPLTSGDSNSTFGLVLPDGASCPGDSFHDDWRVQSFLVPATDDPAQLRYGIIRADGEGRLALYGSNTMPFVHAMTDRSDGSGSPGRIMQPAPFTFSVWAADTVTPGRYRLGLACTLHRETATYWDIEIEVTAAPEVRPGRFAWTVVENPEANVQSAGVDSAMWILLIAGLAVVGGIGAFATRRRQRSASLVRIKEHS